MTDIKRAREALEKLIAIPTVNSAGKYYARLALSYLTDGETSDQEQAAPIHDGCERG